MKKSCLRKAASFLLSGCMMLSFAAFMPSASVVTEAADKSRVSVHDPSIFKADDGTYYVFGSHIDAAKTTDLQNWTTFTNGYTTTNNAEFGDLSTNLAKAFAWAGEDLEDCEGGYSVWAPDVIYNPDYINDDGTTGAYLMYFCTSSTYKRSVIGFAASQTVEGPYTFVDTLIYSGFTDNDTYVTSTTKNVNINYTSTNVDELIDSGEVTYNSSWFNNHDYNNGLYPNAIDPTIYYDTDGRMYMCYGSWSGGIFSLEIDPTTGKCIHPETGKTSDGRMIDSYFGTKISGGYYKSGEGAFMEYNPDTGYYYLWVTYGGLVSEGGYNMRVFRSESPTGPFYDAAGNPAVLTSSTDLDSIGLKVMGNYKFSSLDKAYMACGHNSVLRDDDGQWYLFYHARFDDGTEYHELRVHTMYFNAEGWPVVSPYEYSGDTIAEYGYETTDIAGEYEYINHGNATDGNIINYQSITLSTDGKISGAVTGTWSQAADSSAAVITIDGQQYDGYFLAAQDENGQTVMSFTAVGNNNQTVWGVQTKAYTGTERKAYDYTNSDYKLVYAENTAISSGKTVYINDTGLLSGVSYFIENKDNDLVLDLMNGLLDDGTSIRQWSKNGSFAQQWRIISEGDNGCRIVSLGDESKCLTVSDSGELVLQTYSGDKNQIWKLTEKNGYYTIVSDNYDDGTLWNITPVYPTVNSGTYTIRNKNSGLFFLDNNDNLVQGSSQNWTITALNDGTYTIQNSYGKAVTVENSSADDGANVILTDNTESDAQKFFIRCNKDGSYSFLSVVSGGNSCLDVYGISTEDGANICQWSYWNGDGQAFILEPAASVIGDVNADGVFNVADVVMMQKYLLDSGNLTDWRAGDLYEDNIIDAMDLCFMKRMLTKKS
jgi:arabinan endo-1,5-alpha-L-arabinosidase